ncbi:MAG: FMN-binding protein [Planctomycetota bacterium]|jgi:electron transport complex protein RnfG
MPQEKKKANYLAQGWLVLLLALAFGAALAGVHATLSGRIRQNKDNDTLGRIPELVPGATAGREKTIGDMTVYEAVDDNGRQVGWVITGSGSGYSPGIEILIGLDMPAEKITGLYVLEHKETPGLGSKISDDPRWAEQFIDKSAAEPLTVTKKAPAGNEILAVTAATTTSEGVCRIVNGAVRKFRDALARAGGRDPLLETIPQAVPGTRTAEKMTVGGLVVYKAADDSGRHVGWAVLASGSTRLPKG